MPWVQLQSHCSGWLSSRPLEFFSLSEAEPFWRSTFVPVGLLPKVRPRRKGGEFFHQTAKVSEVFTFFLIFFAVLVHLMSFLV